MLGGGYTVAIGVLDCFGDCSVAIAEVRLGLNVVVGP